LLKPLLIWFGLLDLLGWLHFPLGFRVGRNLRDRGFALSKIAGLLLPTYISWILCHADFSHTRATILGVIAFTSAACAGLAWRDRRAYGAFFRRRWRVVLGIEALFWASALGAAWVRSRLPAIAFDPNWWGAEKWSDFTLLSALSRQVHFPPVDPWFADFPVNYYYFGHLIWATMTKLTGIAPGVTYNLSLAAIVALATIICFSLGYHLFRSVGLGVLLAWLVVFGGNIKPLAQLYQNSHDAGHFVGWIDFWDSSRAMAWGPNGLVKGTEINEFPSFSFILGDLHPHFSAHPIFLAFLLVLAGLWSAFRRTTFSARDVLLGRLWQWIALAFLAGTLYATNSWDCFIALFLAAAVLPFARGFRRWPAGARLLLGIFIAGLGSLVALRIFFYPFALLFVPPRSFAVTIRDWWPPSIAVESPVALVPAYLRSTFSQWAFYFGLFLFPYLGWLAFEAAARSPRVALDRRTAWFASALAAGLVAYLYGQTGLIGLLVFSLVVFAPGAFLPRRRNRLGFAAILAWFALLVSLLCEWFYYDDAFSGADERINTVFKVYYALWPIAALGAVGACSALWGGSRSPHRRLRRAAALVLAAILAAVGAAYPIFGWTSRLDGYRATEIGYRAEPTLDGLAYFRSLPEYAGDYKAGLWLRANASPCAVVAEAYEWGYSAAGRFAAIGGLTSVLGWTQHETVWREGLGVSDLVALREQAIDDLFSTTSLVRTLDILQALRVDYVAVGPLERTRYPHEGLAKFEFLGRVLFQSGPTTIYGISRRACKDAGGGGER